MHSTARVQQLTLELELYHADVQRRLRVKEQELQQLLVSWHRRTRDGAAPATTRERQAHEAQPLQLCGARNANNNNDDSDDDDDDAGAAAESLDVSPIAPPMTRLRSLSCSPATCVQSAAATTAATTMTAAATTSNNNKRVRFSSASPQVALVSVDYSAATIDDGNDNDNDKDDDKASAVAVQTARDGATPLSSPALLLVRRRAPPQPQRPCVDTTATPVSAAVTLVEHSIADARGAHAVLTSSNNNNDVDDDSIMAADEHAPRLQRARVRRNDDDDAQTRRWLRCMLAHKAACRHGVAVARQAPHEQCGVMPDIVLACGPTAYFD